MNTCGANEQDPQCTNVAGYEYGWELRCGYMSGHNGECKPEGPDRVEQAIARMERERQWIAFND